MFRMIKCFGLVVAYDWVIVAIESICFGFLTDDWHKDLFKLYNYFEDREGYGEVGVFMTFFIYVVLFAFCSLFM